jgi:DNA-binding MarR family transcriptional regulator
MDQDEAQAFVETLELLVRVFQRAATTGHLSLATGAVLARLVREGPMTITALATAESVSQPSMTQLVSRLERDGLARKTAAPLDRRLVAVQVTAQGRRVVQQRRRERASVLQQLVAELKPSDVKAIRASGPALTRLTKLMDSAEAAAS